MNLTARAPIIEQLAILSDTTRARMVGILERHELTVSELCDALQLPQSTVSRHLKALADGGWVASRREGTSRFYSLALDELDSVSQPLWPLVREQVSATAAGAQDAQRLAKVLGLQNRLRVQGDGRPRLTISPACVNTIIEFQSYMWKKATATGIIKDEPLKENDHALDAIRYLDDALGVPQWTSY